MPAPPFLAQRGAYAAARQQVTKKNVSYSFASGVKPAGMLEDASRADMLPLVIRGGNRLGEDPANGGSGSSHWYGSAPVADAMATVLYRATMIVGNGSSGTDRGALVWVGGKDAVGDPGIENCVWFRIRGSGGLACVIGSKQGLLLPGAVTTRVTGANAIVSPSDTIGLEISVSGGIYSYQGLKNGTPIPSALWTDSTNIFGTPGKLWGCGGQSTYSGGHFGSLDCYGMSCLDL